MMRLDQLSGLWQRLRHCFRATLARRAANVAAVAVWAVAALGLTPTPGLAQAVPIFSQNFEGVALGPALDEPATPAGYTGPTNVVTLTPPAGWTNDVSGVPGNGVREWKGWSFTRYDWWWRVAGDQTRSQFARAQGTIAVADPDEYDDLGGGPVANGPPWYNAFVRTNAISLANVSGTTATLTFDSSWRPEGFDDGNGQNNQTATIRAIFNNPANTTTEVLRWDSQTSGQFFHPDAQNEGVTRPITIPAGATTMILEFGLANAGNDWWWAVDNIVVTATVIPEPTSLALGSLAALGFAGQWVRRRRHRAAAAK
jgi:hypothetical protein